MQSDYRRLLIRQGEFGYLNEQISKRLQVKSLETVGLNNCWGLCLVDDSQNLVSLAHLDGNKLEQTKYMINCIEDYCDASFNRILISSPKIKRLKPFMLGEKLEKELNNDDKDLFRQLSETKEFLSKNFDLNHFNYLSEGAIGVNFSGYYQPKPQTMRRDLKKLYNKIGQPDVSSSELLDRIKFENSR